MDNRIFFNPGDSIANIHDYNEAVRKGQIFKKEQQAGDLVIAKGPDDEEYAIRCFEKLQMEFRPKRSRVHYDQVEMRLKVGKQFSDALFGNF